MSSNEIYTLHGPLDWADYLQIREQRQIGGDLREFRCEIAESNRELLATYEELQHEHIVAIQGIENEISSGFEQLSFDMIEISNGISELTAAFQWGFSELLTAVGKLNASLEDLLKIAKSPTQNWAYEQFDIAREAYRKELYQEALEYLHRSIEGHGDHTGYKLEYRFHYLLGAIRLGSFRNNSPNIVNLDKAEKAFVAAARYSRSDFPHESARSLLSAGWAAYCQGKLTDAINYTGQAIAIFPKLGEAQFQMAKLLMHCGDIDAALPPIKKAIDLDRVYAIKIASDKDFNSHEDFVNNLFSSLHHQAKEQVEKQLADIEKKSKYLKNFCLKRGVSNDSFEYSMKPSIEAIDKVNTFITIDTYFSYLDALPYVDKALEGLRVAREKLTLIAEYEDYETKQRSQRQRKTILIIASSVIVLGALLTWLSPTIDRITGSVSFGNASNRELTNGVESNVIDKTPEQRYKEISQTIGGRVLSKHLKLPDGSGTAKYFLQNQNSHLILRVNYLAKDGMPGNCSWNLQLKQMDNNFLVMRAKNDKCTSIEVKMLKDDRSKQILTRIDLGVLQPLVVNFPYGK